MKCPVCVGVDLSISERQGIEIDFCPKCRGVWLDRGELDKIIERSEQPRPEVASPQPPSAPVARPYVSPDPRANPGFPPPHPSQHHHQRPFDDDDDDRHKYKYKKKKSFWSEIFD